MRNRTKGTNRTYFRAADPPFDLQRRIRVKLWVLTICWDGFYDEFQLNRKLNDPESGHHYSENPAYGWVFAFLRPDSPSNSVRLFAVRRLTPSGPARQARCSTPAGRAECVEQLNFIKTLFCGALSSSADAAISTGI